MTSILLPTRKPHNNWHLSCYPQESHHALSMHSNPCIIHAFTFHALSMHSILLSTRHIIIHHPCIIHALCIHALFMQQSCYSQDHNFIGAISLGVHYGDQHTPNLMLRTSYPCNSLHQKHAYQLHSCLPNNAMLAYHIILWTQIKHDPVQAWTTCWLSQ